MLQDMFFHSPVKHVVCDLILRVQYDISQLSKILNNKLTLNVAYNNFSVACLDFVIEVIDDWGLEIWVLDEFFNYWV